MFVNPFDCHIDDVPVELLLELIESQEIEFLKEKQILFTFIDAVMSLQI